MQMGVKLFCGLVTKCKFYTVTQQIKINSNIVFSKNLENSELSKNCFQDKSFN